MTLDRFSSEEVQTQVERSYAAEDRVAHLERIGAGHMAVPCAWCGDGTPASNSASVWRLDGYRHLECHAAIKFLEAEQW